MEPERCCRGGDDLREAAGLRESHSIWSIAGAWFGLQTVPAHLAGLQLPDRARQRQAPPVRGSHQPGGGAGSLERLRGAAGRGVPTRTLTPDAGNGRPPDVDRPRRQAAGAWLGGKRAARAGGGGPASAELASSHAWQQLAREPAGQTREGNRGGRAGDWRLSFSRRAWRCNRSRKEAAKSQQASPITPGPGRGWSASKSARCPMVAGVSQALDRRTGGNSGADTAPRKVMGFMSDLRAPDEPAVNLDRAMLPQPKKG